MEDMTHDESETSYRKGQISGSAHAKDDGSWVDVPDVQKSESPAASSSSPGGQFRGSSGPPLAPSQPLSQASPQPPFQQFHTPSLGLPSVPPNLPYQAFQPPNVGPSPGFAPAHNFPPPPIFSLPPPPMPAGPSTSPISREILNIAKQIVKETVNSYREMHKAEMEEGRMMFKLLANLASGRKEAQCYRWEIVLVVLVVLSLAKSLLGLA